MQTTRSSIDTTKGLADWFTGGHGAATTRFMAHLAIRQNDEQGGPVTWGRHVTDDEYAAALTADPERPQRS